MTAINTAIAVISKPKLDKEYKRVLLAANSDYLSLDSIVAQDDNSTFTFKIEITSLAVTQQMCNNGTALNYLAALNTGALFVGNPAGNNVVGVGEILVGENTIEIRRGVGMNYATINGGTEYTLTNATDPFELKNFSNRAGAFSNISVHDFDINGKTISLNEGNGSIFKSNDGTITGTTETIHLNGLNYINIDII